jgi:hypothetical protein
MPSLSPYNYGLCGAHSYGDSSYILAKHILQSQTMVPEKRVIQSNQDVHVCGYEDWN